MELLVDVLGIDPGGGAVSDWMATAAELRLLEEVARDPFTVEVAVPDDAPRVARLFAEHQQVAHGGEGDIEDWNAEFVELKYVYDRLEGE